MDEPEFSQITCPLCRTTFRDKSKSLSCGEMAAVIASVFCCVCMFAICLAFGPDNSTFYDPYCTRRNSEQKHRCPNCRASFTVER